MKSTGAFIAGLVIGMAANLILISINMVFYPAPKGLDLQDQDAWREYAASLPPEAFLIPILAHLAQAFFGGWTAARLAPEAPMRMALILGGVSMVGGIMNLNNLSPPIWMWGELPFYLIVAYAAGLLEQNRRASGATHEKGVE